MGNPGYLFYVILAAFFSFFTGCNRNKGTTFPEKSTIQTLLHVSPDGSGNQFTKNNPGSLAGAREKIRTLNSTMSGHLVVCLHGGTYFFDSTFRLGSDDSGNNGFSVIWQAAPGEKPVLSGGKEITGWSLYDNKNNIWKTNVGTLNFRQLYVNGQRAVRARTPNMTDVMDKGTYARILSWNNFRPAIPAHLLSEVKEIQKVEFCVNMYWQHFRYRIDSYTVNGDSAFLSFKMPEAAVAPIPINNQAPFILEMRLSFSMLKTSGFWIRKLATFFINPKKKRKWNRLML
jgi:hypothetical protein